MSEIAPSSVGRTAPASAPTNRRAIHERVDGMYTSPTSQLNGAKAPRGRRGVQRVQNQARPMLGLPATIRACLFDLDGVLTQTATAHAAAWKEMFDAFLRARAAETGEAFVPFDPVADYRAYVD